MDVIFFNKIIIDVSSSDNILFRIELFLEGLEIIKSNTYFWLRLIVTFKYNEQLIMNNE